MIFITILTISQISGTQMTVMVILNRVCAFAICLEITAISGPFGEIYWIRAAYGFTNQINRKHPEILKMRVQVRFVLHLWSDRYLQAEL